jgi:hypothetical protein
MTETKIVYGYCIGLDECSNIFPIEQNPELYEIKRGFIEFDLTTYDNCDFIDKVEKLIDMTDKICIFNIHSNYENRSYFGDKDKCEGPSFFIGVEIKMCKPEYDGIMSISTQIPRDVEEMLEEFENLNPEFKGICRQLYTYTCLNKHIKTY